MASKPDKKKPLKLKIDPRSVRKLSAIDLDAPGGCAVGGDSISTCYHCDVPDDPVPVPSGPDDAYRF